MKKKPIIFESKLKKSKDDITQVDANTFYVKSSDPDKDPYFIYHDMNDRWLCECMDFIIHLPDDGMPVTHKCKHILRCMLRVQ